MEGVVPPPLHQNPRTTPFWRKVNFTPWGMTEGGVGVIRNVLRMQSYSFGNLEPHAKFQNPSTAPSLRIWVGVIFVLVLVTM